MKYYTVGTAGHIDHGKTSLIKALTNVDTDRLKEEKERNITIELGFAPLQLSEEQYLSFIDVPGHEKFIRQMISGVTGIDVMMLVVAADEGVMPQTKEHLDILSLLEVKKGIVVITKIDKVDEEFSHLVEEEIREQLQGTVFYDSPFIFVDNLTGAGIPELKELLSKQLENVIPRQYLGAFRLPIDQVFTLKGQGTVVRGTIYEGMVHPGDSLYLLPENQEIRARQVHVFGNSAEIAAAGQRAAININLEKEEVKRGDVLVSSHVFKVTDTIDVSLTVLPKLKHAIKQHMPVKVHVGTSDVMGKVIFYDRNEVTEGTKKILCQIKLDKEIVVKRGDHYIIRRPSPQETLGGGIVIDPNGKKRRFGESTIENLKKREAGTPIERMEDQLNAHYLLTYEGLRTNASVEQLEIEEGVQTGRLIEIGKKNLTSEEVLEQVITEFQLVCSEYEKAHPMRVGIPKAEAMQVLQGKYPKALLEFVLPVAVQKEYLTLKEHFVSTANYEPQLVSKWKTRMQTIIQSIEEAGVQVRPFDEYCEKEKLPAGEREELKTYLLGTERAYQLDPIHLISYGAFHKVVQELRENTKESFTLQEAKNILEVSRKYLVPLIELLDKQKLTVRQNEERVCRQTV